MIEWKQQTDRSLAVSGEVAVGAVFTPTVPGPHVRWRAWVTRHMNPIDGTSPDVRQAKAAVEKRFEEFCRLAALYPKPTLDTRIAVAYSDGSMNVLSDRLGEAKAIDEAKAEAAEDSAMVIRVPAPFIIEILK